MQNYDQGYNNAGPSVSGLMLGVLAGVGLGMLFAPRSGKETRAKIKDKANELKSDVQERAEDVMHDAENKVQEVKREVRSAMRNNTSHSKA